MGSNHTGVRRLTAIVGVLTTIGATGVVGAPGVLAAQAHAGPTVTAVTLGTSDTKVTSSTKHKLHVELDADQEHGHPSAVEIALHGGSADEEHTWTFPISASALKVNSAGKGTLKLPDSRIAPFGAVSLKITPTGAAKTTSCNSALASKTQHVKVSGTFYFVTKSSGADKWGSIGSKSPKKPFTFSKTNSLVWHYLPEAQDGCGDDGDGDFVFPCSAQLIWDDSVGDVDVEGVNSASLGISLIFGIRTVSLDQPTGATREDDLSAAGPSPQLVTTPDPLATGAFSASLPVSVDEDGTGEATLASATSSVPQQLPCGVETSSQMVNASLWEDCTFTNGATPLSLDAEVFGAVTLPDNTSAEVLSTTPAA